MVYFPPLHGVIAFGGEGPYGSAYYNDTWLFHGGNWTQLSPTVSPGGRSQFVMAYDPFLSVIVLFGGTNGGSQELQDTWLFNGTTWQQLNLRVHPAGRMAASMVYDPASSGVLLFGGSNTTFGAQRGTWEFKAGAWQLLPNTRTPIRSWTPVTNLANGTPVFMGGQDGSLVFNTSYEFYGGSWNHVRFAHAPSPRELGGIIYDGRAGYVLYFAGCDPPTFYNDTLALY